MSPAQLALENRLSNGDLDGALEGLLALARHYGDKARTADAVLLSGRYRNLLQQQQHELLSLEDYQLERNQISYATHEMVQQVPFDWSVSALPPSTTKGRVAARKSRFPWVAVGLAGLVAVAALVWWVGRKPEVPAATTAVPAPATSAATTPDTVRQPTRQQVPPPAPTQQPVRQQPTVATRSQPRTSEPQRQPASTTTPAPQPQTTATTATQPASTPQSAGYATNDGKFHGFSKMSEGMERGQIDQKFAFRNLTTKAMLCCYEAADDFRNGRARVVQNGQTFYIDKNGQRVKE